MGTSLKDWLNNNQTIESKQKVFYNMSKTLEYINEAIILKVSILKK